MDILSKGELNMVAPVQSLCKAIHEHIGSIPSSKSSAGTDNIDILARLVTQEITDCDLSLSLNLNPSVTNNISSKTTVKSFEVESSKHQLTFVHDKQVLTSLDEGTRKKTAKLRKLALYKLENGTELFYISNGREYLKGYKMEHGIFCYCCSGIISASKFESHAGFASRRQPYQNIYTSQRVSLQNLAGSYTEFDIEQQFETVARNKEEPNKRDIVRPKEIGGCGICRGSTFKIDGEIQPTSFVFCGQCEKLYHVGCLKDHGMADISERPSPWFNFLCSVECKEVNSQLKCFVESSPHEDGFMKWSILSGVCSDKTSENEDMFMKAKLIFGDAFGKIMVDGNDVLPAMVEGGEASKQYFGGMHCVVVTKDSEVVSCGVVRVFGRDLAELPLVATGKEWHGNGYFKLLVNVVEKLMVRMKVKSLVVCVDEDTQSFWMDMFGFVKISEEKAKLYAEDHWIIRFKKKIMLEKTLVF